MERTTITQTLPNGTTNLTTLNNSLFLGAYTKASANAVTNDFVTRTLSATDPYVTGGFYIAFVNNSGASCTVEDGFQLVIINQYQ